MSLASAIGAGAARLTRRIINAAFGALPVTRSIWFSWYWMVLASYFD